MIIKEYRCLDCGTQFESSDSEPSCPSCSAEEPERAFFTAPAFKSPQTTFKDDTVKQLAADYGLSNISNKHGQPVRQAPQGAAAPSFATGTPQGAQILQRLGGNADGFSSVLPTLQRAGRPHQWAKMKERK